MYQLLSPFFLSPHLYIYIYIYIYTYLPTPPLRQTSCLTKAEEISLPYYLSRAGGRIVGFIHFLRVLVLCEMQSVASRIWTRVAVSICYDDNHYTIYDLDFCQWTRHCWLTSKNFTISAMCGQWVHSKGTVKSNRWLGRMARESQENPCYQRELIYIYICVCVCVCVCFKLTTHRTLEVIISFFNKCNSPLLPSLFKIKKKLKRQKQSFSHDKFWS